MSFNSSEISTRNGEPLEFVKFAIDSDYVYRYTNALVKQTYLGEDYLPVFMLRSSISESQELENAKMTITVDRESPIVALFVSNNVARKMRVAIWRYHKNDGEVVSYWQGTVSAVTRSSSTAEIVCESPEAELERTSLRQFFQPTCRFFLGDGKCPVPLEAVKVVGQCISVNTGLFQIQVAECATKPNGYFSYGFIEHKNDIRFIISHTSQTLTLLSSFQDSPIGNSVEVFAGCDNLPATCNDKFGTWTENGKSFGGFYVSVENPFNKGVR